MKKLIERYPNKSRRVFEMLIPLFSWGLITMPFWLSFWHPALVAYFVVMFDVYWFYKSFLMAYNGVRAFLTLSAHVKVDWLVQTQLIKGWNRIIHIVIIPEFNEPVSVLEETLVNLSQQEFPLKQVIVVLATEAFDVNAQTTANLLTRKYKHLFKYLWVTKHELKSSETKGKSSNIAWAGKWAAKQLTRLGIESKHVIVTSCDADVLLHPKYLAYLTYKFLTDSDRYYHFYQPAILFYSNIWRIPLPGRVVNTMNSIFNLSILPQTDKLINFSTYSVSFDTVKKVGFWGVNVIPEDYHLFFKTYFQLGEKVKTKPLYLPVLADAAEAKGFWKSIVNQYEQHKRWAWGVSDVPFVLKNYFTNSTIPFWNKTMRVLHLLESHINWPTNWFILTLGSTIPPIINKNFARTVLGHNLAQISSAILTLCIGFLMIMIFLDIRAKPPRPKEFKAWKIPILYLQWLTLPIVSFFLSALPGLDAHTRLMLGKRLEYRVTEKI